METTLVHSSHSCSSLFSFNSSTPTFHRLKTSKFPLNLPNVSIKSSFCCSAFATATLCTSNDNQRRIASVGSRFCYDEAIPEQNIDEPVGVSVIEKDIGNEQRCDDCEAEGAVVCVTCGGSGLYVDSIMECQGIVVQVRCLGCGGTGNIMCSECGGRGHL